jgi:hypothetical protein
VCGTGDRRHYSRRRGRRRRTTRCARASGSSRCGRVDSHSRRISRSLIATGTRAQRNDAS